MSKRTYPWEDQPSRPSPSSKQYPPVPKRQSLPQKRVKSLSDDVASAATPSSAGWRNEALERIQLISQEEWLQEEVDRMLGYDRRCSAQPLSDDAVKALSQISLEEQKACLSGAFSEANASGDGESLGVEAFLWTLLASSDSTSFGLQEPSACEAPPQSSAVAPPRSKASAASPPPNLARPKPSAKKGPNRPTSLHPAPPAQPPPGDLVRQASADNGGYRNDDWNSDSWQNDSRWSSNGRGDNNDEDQRWQRNWEFAEDRKARYPGDMDPDSHHGDLDGGDPPNGRMIIGPKGLMIVGKVGAEDVKSTRAPVVKGICEGTIPVPKVYLAKVIGKGAAGLLEIKNKSGVMNIDARNQTTDPVPVNIMGSAEAVKKAEKMVLDILDRLMNKWTNTEFIEVPKSEMGCIMGFKGQYLNRLQDESGTKLDADFSTDPAKIYINGDPEQVELAKQLIRDRLTNPADDPNAVILQLPLKASGVILGKQGQRVRALQDETNTQIIVEKHIVGNHCRVSIRGEAANVSAAKEQIMDLISGQLALPAEY
eukprot:TRINITY_DN10593_c0_g1_i6.p1 TRINITY_DN10593_c0_g1~~TRINITY_DN10593_c0_g1_i6.p1  ORF type:complete len:540 (+),score=114.84 TRINITY_DN10593_c0_g1_i6:76-1695(+)